LLAYYFGDFLPILQNQNEDQKVAVTSSRICAISGIIGKRNIRLWMKITFQSNTIF
jgi:hypothetical protein